MRPGDWTPEHDAELMRLSGRMPDRELALHLTQVRNWPTTDGAIQKRRARLHALNETRETLSGRGRVPLSHEENDGPPTLRSDPRPEIAPPPIPPAPPIDVYGHPYVPHPTRGPASKPHYVPAGHELGGVSRLKDKSGNVVAEWDKTRVAGADEPPLPIPEDFLLDRASVLRRGDGSTVVQWASYKRDAIARWDDIKSAVQRHVDEYARAAAPVTAPNTTDVDRLTVYPIGDPHIGMLSWAGETGENFDLKIAERELCECFRQLVARSPEASRAIVTNLGDFWHAQDDIQRTPTNGNKLDVDGRFGKVGKVGLAIVQSLVDAALTKHAHVTFRSIPGNHDPNSAFWLPLYLKAVYKNEPRVTVEEGFAPYQYDVFGRVLLGWAHGDGCKLEDLGEIMATDVPEQWGSALHRAWHTGHVHHWQTKELRGCVVDSHRTLAGRDAWHHHSGYRSGRALKAVSYHRDYGLDSIAVVGIERVRAALGAGT